MPDTIGHSNTSRSLAPLLKRLQGPYYSRVGADEIALAFESIFENQVCHIQYGAFLTLLSVRGLDLDSKIIAKCAKRAREMALPFDHDALREILKKSSLKQGNYGGGFCDIVGTGGDGHDTFNVSTAASIIASSSLLMAKHGNVASSSSSGSANLMHSVLPRPPDIGHITAETLTDLYRSCNYGFLFAPTFHTGMKYAAPIRKALAFPTVFNRLGPLTNPVHQFTEARVVGVSEKKLGPIFAEALWVSGVRKALVVCGEEDLDEISCAGPTNCWRLTDGKSVTRLPLELDEDSDYIDRDDDENKTTAPHIEHFQICPDDFGLQRHPLSEVAGGHSPRRNAEILHQILQNELPEGHPILDFVLMNTAALLAVSGVLGGGSEQGPGGLMYKKGVMQARQTLRNASAAAELRKFVDATHRLGKESGWEERRMSR